MSLIEFYYTKIDIEVMELNCLEVDPSDLRAVKPCSTECFRLLDKEKYVKFQMQKVKFLSQMVRSLFEMGIDLFCFEPCKIAKLFSPSNKKNGISCSLAFVYWIEEYNLEKRIENKFYESEIECLKHESMFDTTEVIPV